MRCLSCNCVLTDKEATRKYASSGTFIDLCDSCFDPVEDQIPSIEGRSTEETSEDSDGYSGQV